MGCGEAGREKARQVNRKGGGRDGGKETDGVWLVKMEETATGEMVRARERQRDGDCAFQERQKKSGAEKHEKNETERDGRYQERRAKEMPQT